MPIFYKQTIDKHDLEKIGYSTYQAQNLIRQSKEHMVKLGYDLYKNRKIVSVPTSVIKTFLGFEPKIPKGNNDYVEKN